MKIAQWSCRELIEGRLIEPIYVFDSVALRAGSVVEGHVAEIGGVPARRRLTAILSGNFTPPRYDACRGPIYLDRDTYAEQKREDGERFEFQSAGGQELDQAIGSPGSTKGLRMCSSSGTRKSDRMLTINTPNNARPRMMSIVRTRSIGLAVRQSHQGSQWSFGARDFFREHRPVTQFRSRHCRGRV